MAIHTLAQNQTTTGANPWVAINPSKSRTFQVIISGVAAVDIEASNDGVNPVNPPLQSASASAGYVDSDPWHYIRANVKSVTSGAVTVIVGEA